MSEVLNKAQNMSKVKTCLSSVKFKSQLPIKQEK